MVQKILKADMRVLMDKSLSTLLTRTALERRQSLISPALPRLSLTARAASSERASILSAYSSRISP